MGHFHCKAEPHACLIQNSCDPVCYRLGLNRAIFNSNASRVSERLLRRIVRQHFLFKLVLTPYFRTQLFELKLHWHLAKHMQRNPPIKSFIVKYIRAWVQLLFHLLETVYFLHKLQKNTLISDTTILMNVIDKNVRQQYLFP